LIRARPGLTAAALLLCVLPCWALADGSPSVAASGPRPLEPIDTSSPRSTLEGFLKFADDAHGTGVGVLEALMAHPREEPTKEQLGRIAESQQLIVAAERALDFSQVPAATVEESSRRTMILLKEILDRLDLPPLESVPDAGGMANLEVKRWTLPNSEIQIAKMATGPRAGEYLFTAETVARIPEFYARVKNLPYRSAATANWYEIATNYPIGVALALRKILPPGMVLGLPEWSRFALWDQPLWRWIGIIVIVAAGVVVISFFFYISRIVGRGRVSRERWYLLLRPLSLVLVVPIVEELLTHVLRVTGGVYLWSAYSFTTIFFLALSWTVWAAGGAFIWSLIAAEHTGVGSIDSQVIRMIVRLVNLVLVAGILITGADRMGLPAYSVVAGLGVGGLAVALAAQQTLANLLGSLIIIFEKPFAVGHWIKVQGAEGKVEGVGFRSTRIRTSADSVVSIPSSQLINGVVDNLNLRNARLVSTVLNLTYDTSVDKIEGFIQGIKQILEKHPATRKNDFGVAFNDFGAHSLDVVVTFFLLVPDRSSELERRQEIFMDILKLAESQGVKFAFPTQTLHIEQPTA
jgi:MscS family membrane protein